VQTSLGGLVWWSLRDLRDRYLRLIQSFEELSGPASRAGKRVFGAAGETLRQDLLNFEREVLSFQQASLEIALEESKYDKALAISRDYRREYLATAGAIFPYLPLGAHPPDDLRFFLMRSLGLSLVTPSDDEVFSLAYSGKPYWEMRMLPPNSSEPFVAAIPVPFPESLTPLRWPLLVHELGHVVDGSGRKVSEALLNEVAQLLTGFTTNDESAQLISKELVADAVAAAQCGEAYVWAFATEALFQDQLMPWAAHLTRPATIDARTRIAILTPDTDLDAVLATAATTTKATPSLDKDAIALIRDALATALRAAQLDFISSSKLATRAISEIGASIGRPHREALAMTLLEDRTTATTLGQAVRSAIFGTPALTLPDSSVVAALRAELTGTTEYPGIPAPGLLKSDASGVYHEPASDAAILTAAWELYAGGDVTAQHQAFVEESLLGAADTLDSAKLDHAMDRVVRFDTNVARALESAAVHRWLMEYMP